MPPPQGGFMPGGYPGGYPPPDPGFIQPPPAGYNTYNDDPEAPKNFSFDDQIIRKAFLRKVYSILMVRLAIVVSFYSIKFLLSTVSTFGHFWICNTFLI